MSYAAYAEPSKGYQPYAAPEPGLVSDARPAAGRATAGGKEGTFLELLATDGVGDYHVNHFVGYGAYLKSPGKLVATMNQKFYDQFIELFSPNKATADRGDYLFHGDDTIEFGIGGKRGSFVEKLGGLLHSDWVSMQMSTDGESFYASTLKRNWLLPLEKAAVDLDEDMRGFIEVNQHHFLAGRRSFKIGYSEEMSRLYIETAALERSSLCEYNVIERTGALRAVIIDLWTHLIENVQKRHGKWISPTELPKTYQGIRKGYQVKRKVDYRVDKSKNAGQALKASWFQQVVQRHPGLVKGLPL